MARPIPFVPPTTYSRAPASDSGRADRVVVGWTARICSIRSARTRSIRVDLEVHLVAGDREDAGARHVAQDEAAVVGGGEVAGRLGRRVGAAQDVGAEDLRVWPRRYRPRSGSRRRPPRRR